MAAVVPDPTTYEVVAYNYAHDSDNKIHDDTVAAQYGFKGGLVPGVADYAYLCQAVYRRWGDAWLRGGTMEAKFIKPIYDGEVARAEARPDGGPDAQRVELALIDPRGVTCSVGKASRSGAGEAPALADYPHRPLPAPGALLPPAIETVPAGHVLGSYDFVHDAATIATESAELFVENITAADGEVRWHPAYCLHLANLIVRENIDLGPWVHTGSQARYFDAPVDGESVSVRGSVIETYDKRGHVVTDCDIAVFASPDVPGRARALAAIKHTAIIRLAGPE